MAANTPTAQTSFSVAAVTPVTAVENPPQWSINNTSGSGVQATISKAAGVAGVTHVCTGITASVVVATALAGGLTATVNLRDGASGAGTILWTTQLGLAGTAAIGTAANVSITGLNIPGSSATAMTLEFAALTTTSTQSVTLTGYDQV